MSARGQDVFGLHQYQIWIGGMIFQGGRGGGAVVEILPLQKKSGVCNFGTVLIFFAVAI